MVEQMLDQDGVRAWFAAHGYTYTPRQIARMATNRKLPFRRGPDGKRLFVPLSALERFLMAGSEPPKKEPQYRAR